MDDFLSSREIARRLSIDKATVSSIAKMHNLTVQKDMGYHSWRYSLSEIQTALVEGHTNQTHKNVIRFPQTKTYSDYWKLPWDEFIIGCDTHSPYVYLPIWEKMIKVANKYKIKNFIHAGDFWNQDQFSTWWVAKEDTITFDEEVKASKILVKELTNNFNEVRFFLGSHDIRFWRLLYSQGKYDSYETVWKLLENNKIRVSSYRYCEIGNEWRINHPKNTVKVGGLSAVRMGAKFNRSVVFGHGHWQGFVFNPVGNTYLQLQGVYVTQGRLHINAFGIRHTMSGYPGLFLSEIKSGQLSVMKKLIGI